MAIMICNRKQNSSRLQKLIVKKRRETNLNSYYQIFRVYPFKSKSRQLLAHHLCILPTGSISSVLGPIRFRVNPPLPPADSTKSYAPDQTMLMSTSCFNWKPNVVYLFCGFGTF